MNKFYNLIILIVLCIKTLSGQEYDLILSSPESGTQTHEAFNSITLAPNYSYTSNGGTLACNILGSLINGPVSYGLVIDPENRTLNTSSYLVGATKGSFNINPTGGASYTIPLELLPGVNGLAPDLSLVYSGNGGPGIAGYGWQIAGLSAISRGAKTYYHDGKATGIELDTTDRFYLDGQRLVTTNSYAYGNASAEYQTVNDIFTRVKQYGTDAYGPGYFKAETKSGLVYEYGNTTASKQKIGTYNQVVNWYVSKVSDQFGNQINFAYQQDNYSLYPTEINYGPNTITFYYKVRSDNNTYYLKGEKVGQRYILDKVTVKYNSTIVKTYELKYNFQGSYYNSYSTLNEVIEYGIGTSRVNSTAITYQIPDNVSFSQAIYNTSETYISHDSRLFSGDFNGDGRSDIFCLPSTGGWRYYKSNGDNTFTLSSTGDFDITESTIDDLIAMDINGDNKDDIVFNTFTTSRKYYYAESYGTGFSRGDKYFAGSGGQAISKQYKSCANDIDGDGLNDYVTIEPSGEIKMYSFSYHDGGLWSMSLRNTLNFGSSVSSSDIVFLADFNGDGLADIWKINSAGIKIYAVRGSSLIVLYTSAIPTTSHYFKSGDYNGDGKTDLFLYGYSTSDWSDWQIRLSTGTNFETIYVPKKKTNLKNDILRTGDFNGDGCTDIMVTASTTTMGHYYFISKNRGTDFYSHSYSSGMYGTHNFYVDDYDGDGRDDYLCTCGISSTCFTGYMIYKAPGKTSTLMEKVGNGLGFTTKLIYTKLSQASSSIYQRGTAIFPVSDFQGPISVVSSVQYDNGVGTQNTQNYYYEGLKIHQQGKGFLCYAKTRVTDVATGIISESTSDYNTTYFCPQTTGSSKKLTGQTDPYETVTNSWSQKVLNAAKKRIFPYVQSAVQSNALTGYSETITRDYDSYGNPITITKSYNNGVNEIITNTFDNTVSTTKWLLGRATLSQNQFTDNVNNIIRSINRTYSSTNNNVLTKTLYPGTNKEISHTYSYYANGTLQTEMITAGTFSRTSQYTYEANGIRIQTITNPLSHLTTNTYDTYGRLYMQQDSLTTNTVTYLYDNLHRQTSVSTNDGSGSTLTYAWQEPTSTPLLARYSLQSTGNKGSQSKIWYDKLGREIRSDVKGFDGTMIYTSTEYNIKGQVYRISEPDFSTTAVWNTMAYDNYGRKTSLTTPSGENSTWQYTNNTITETTAGKTFSKTYAADGTMSSATDAGGTINYTYLPDGKVKTITAPGGIITSMQYDIAGNQTQLVDPSAGTLNSTYNGFGELLTQQNERSQTTSFTYYADGRLSQKVTVEGTISYTYNADKQLTGISSPGSVSRSYGYDSKGRVSNITETIPGSTAFTTTFTYDNKGRLSTTTYPSGITETNIYNTNGYLASVSAGGATRWTTTAMNAKRQVTAGQYGSNLNTTFGYNAYGYPTSTVTGTLQNYQYDFNPVTGNLNWRKNVLQANIQENFEYDNLDRLDRIYRGSTTLLDMAYDVNKGGITTKSDVGTLIYNTSGKPYALSNINPSTGLVPSTDQTLTFTSFESINTISEGNYSATFIYSSDKQRAKMEIQQNSNTILTRWYSGSRYVKETTGGVTKEYTFIGGDAYTAPVATVTQSGTTTYYNLLRDYLGSITHVVNASNNVLVAEYSYDAWGRMRNPSTWANYTPYSEPDLFIAGRGFTGHEHLKWFNLINMNGRCYDPLTGQFLSPDNYVQAPGFTQSYNRFSYCLNNPLKYIDPSGEKFKWWSLLTGPILVASVPVLYPFLRVTGHNSDEAFQTCADFILFSTGQETLTDRERAKEQNYDPIVIGIGDYIYSIPYVPDDNDVIISDFPDNLNHQKWNVDCFTTGMEYLSIFYGQSITNGTYENYYISTYKAYDFLQNGINSKDRARGLLSHFYDIDEINSLAINNAIENHNPVLANIFTGMDENGIRETHNLIIIGYNDSNRTYIIMDPATGQRGRVEMNAFLLFEGDKTNFYFFEVFGIKP